MKLLITGVSGQLGKAVYKISRHETYGTYLKNRPTENNSRFFKIDIGNKSDVERLTKKIKPDWVFHFASETNVDLCEENKDLAFRSNVVGTKNIADACASVNAKLLLVSSDYVFDGKRGHYKEMDVPNPPNFYAKTRLMGEWMALTNPQTLIARTSILYSSAGKFASWVLSAAKKGEITAITDLYNCPTFTTELAENLLKMAKKDLRGVYHTVGSERISKYDFVKKFVQVFGYGPDIVKPIKMKDVPFKAARVRDSSLDISKIRKEGIKFSGVDDALKRLKKEIA